MTSKVKKIISIVIISLILAITVAVVVLALIPKKLYNPVPTDYTTLTVYRNKKSQTYLIDDGHPEHKEINAELSKLIEKSVKDNLLSSIFQGTGKFENQVICKNEGNVTTNIANVSGTYCLKFNFLEERVLMWEGQEYTNPNKSGEDKRVKYSQIYMPISNSDEFEQRYIYLANSAGVSDYQITFLAHQSEIFDFIADLVFA